MRVQERRFRVLIEHSSDAIALLAADGTVLYASPSTAVILGSSPEQFLGTNALDRMQPDDAPVVAAQLARVVSEPGEPVTSQFRYRHEDGSWRWLEAVTSNLLAEPSVQAVIVNYRDITERKRAEEALGERAWMAWLGADVGFAFSRSNPLCEVLRECAETMVEHLDAALARIWTVGPGATQLELRASAGVDTALDGHLSRVAIGETAIGDIAEERRPLVTNAGAGEAVPSEDAWIAREGIVAFAGHPLVVEDRLVGVIAVFSRKPFNEVVMRTFASVVSWIAVGIERKRIDEELERTLRELSWSNVELERFAYVASHHLHEPLRQMAAFTQLLARRYLGRLDAEADLLIGYATAGARRMQALINDLLAHSRVANASDIFHATDCDAVLEQALGTLGAVLTERGVEVVHEPLTTLTADADQLRELFVQLLDNATKFGSTEPPRIWVSAKRDGANWVFSVRDNGMGIDPQYATRTFRIFERLQDDAHSPGTGVGLAICEKIVQRHGGRIWVESELGKGATFRFTLPVAPDAVVPSSRHVAHTA